VALVEPGPPPVLAIVVNVEIVPDDVNLSLGTGTREVLHEGNEVHGAPLWLAFAEHLARADIGGCEQRPRAVTCVLEFEVAGAAGSRKLGRKSPSERLHAGLLVEAQRARRPQPDHQRRAGEFFIVRNVGNIVPAVGRGVIGGVAAAVEYAVEILGVQNVICGHTRCGVIEAILEPERARHFQFVSRWLGESATIPALLREKYSHLTGEARLDVASEENVLVQFENLRSYTFVSKQLEEEKLKLAGWVFKIAAAQVFG